MKRQPLCGSVLQFCIELFKLVPGLYSEFSGNWSPKTSSRDWMDKVKAPLLKSRDQVRYTRLSHCSIAFESQALYKSCVWWYPSLCKNDIIILLTWRCFWPVDWLRRSSTASLDQVTWFSIAGSTRYFEALWQCGKGEQKVCFYTFRLKKHTFFSLRCVKFSTTGLVY